MAVGVHQEHMHIELMPNMAHPTGVGMAKVDHGQMTSTGS